MERSLACFCKAPGRGQALFSIQYLRGLAALAVASIHALDQVLERSQSAPLQFLRGGVDIAFVISGFIMWHVLLRRPLSPRAFLQRRALRVVPLYWAVTTTMVLTLLLAPEYLQTTRFQLAHVLATYAFLAWPSPVPGAGMRPLLMPGWTLNLEVFFYFLVAISLLLPLRAQKGGTVALLLLMVIIGTCLLPKDARIAGFYTSPVLLEFAGGTGVAMLVQHTVGMNRPVCLALIVAGSIGFFVIGNHINLEETNRLLVFGPSACMLVTGMVLLDLTGFMPRLVYLKLVGDASYSIYLTHPLLVSALAQLWKHSFLADGPTGLFVGVSLLGSVLLGVSVNRFIERPIAQILASAATPTI